jgi:hypothetical protein
MAATTTGSLDPITTRLNNLSSLTTELGRLTILILVGVLLEVVLVTLPVLRLVWLNNNNNNNSNSNNGRDLGNY